MRRNVRRNNRQESSQERQDGRQKAAVGSPRETAGRSEKLDATANSALPLNSEADQVRKIKYPLDDPTGIIQKV